MAYKALYRKYRPQTFDEVYGQDHIVKTLQNAIKNEKLAHAYLFCGPRGTGKTSIAKLLAKTLNCEAPDHRPCGKCSSCIEIQESINPDVIEMDGATNNGVDEIRALVESVKFAPIHGRYKVYIIDEVHMITPNAFNALLKTLEEPPEYCIFVLATTDPQKVLPTIVSRCQRFDFKKLTVSVIRDRISEILDKENIKCEEEAINLIAELADGGMRDALSILDQCVAYAENNITAKQVGEVYGVASTREKMEIFRAIKDKDVTLLINKVNEFAGRGIDLKRLTTDLASIAKEAVIYSYTRNDSLLSQTAAYQANEMLSNFSTNQLLQQIDYLLETAGNLTNAVDVVSYLEVCFLKMVGIREDSQNVPERSMVTDAQDIPSQPVQPAETEKPVEKPVEKPAIKREIKNIKKVDDDEFLDILLSATKAIKEADRESWNEVISCREARYMPVVSMIQGCNVMADGPDDIIIVVGERVVADNINELENLALLEELSESRLGKRKKIVAITSEQQDYLINYFKSHRAERLQQLKEAKNKKEEPVKEEDNPQANLEKLFGKDGYDIVN